MTDLKPGQPKPGDRFFEIAPRGAPSDERSGFQAAVPRTLGLAAEGLRGASGARTRWDFHLIFTDLEWSHRFVIFKCERRNKARVHDLLQSLLGSYREHDATLVEYNLVIDNEFSEETDRGAKKSAVCDFDREICELNLMTINNSLLYPELMKRTAVSNAAYDVLRKTETSIGKLHLLAEEELRMHERWKALAFWFFEFKRLMEPWVIDPLFYELRPIKFK